ncbi:MAG: (Fe-S)-binding protein [Betaproteobacteria bacterium]|jgi:Fe-S oxidoreductase|nr:(Fe-S)-binding protein [Betaproteobacteria bacterium]
MSAADVNQEHPLELESPRVSVKKPAARYDKQGDVPDAERVKRAMQNFVKDFGRTAAIYMESCIHCGMCADACHFYVTTENPKYTPIWKLEPFKQAYKREYGPFAWLYRTLNLKGKITVERLEEWQELIYDSCTVCGRCSLMCPMGIDIASLVSLARHGMAKSGLVPHELWAVAERAEKEGSPLGATPKVFKDRIEWLADDHEVEIPVDKEKADVMCTMSSIEIMKYPDSIVATARIMNHLGVDWTFRLDGYEATNFGLLSGNAEWQKDMSLKLINAAIACGAKTLVLPECGHAYGALRWSGANMYGKPLPFRVMHIAEFLAENTKSGKLKLKKLGKSVTFHDPCQIARRGGAIEAPRDVLAALGVELREMEPGKGLNWCCGGGGGVVTIHRADPIRYKVFQLKMNQIEETGAELPVTSCANCRQTFDDGQAHFKWDKKMNSLLEMVADNLEGKAA